MSIFSSQINSDGLLLTVHETAKSWFSGFFKPSLPKDITHLPKEDSRFIEAFASLRALGEFGGVEIEPDRVFISHDVISRIDDRAAHTLELPPTVEFKLKMEMNGQLGSASFSLKTQWLDSGRTVIAKRNGAILTTERGIRRIPSPMLRAVIEAEKVTEGPPDLAKHWERLALFRNALEPSSTDPESMPDFAQQCSMNSFIEGLRLTACASMSITEGDNESDFNVIPFAYNDSRTISEEPEEADALLEGNRLRNFHKAFRARGATPAYKVADGEFLVLTPGVMPLAELMAEKQRAPLDERRAFIMNPEPYVQQAYRSFGDKRLDKELDAAEEVMGAADYEVLEEVELNNRLVVTIEYRDRVIGMGRFESPDLSAFGISPFSSSWMAERISKLVEYIADVSEEELTALENRIESVGELDPNSNTAVPDITIEGTTLPVSSAQKLLEAERHKRNTKILEGTGLNDTQSDSEDEGPQILVTDTNYEEIDWHPPTVRRVESLGSVDVPSVSSTLMPHQVSSLDWAQRAWAFGMPGVLNADEQGLGKTLQTLAFLAWLHKKMGNMEPQYRRPFLIIAPTSLLRNWEAEIEEHLHSSQFVTITRLYGSQLNSMKLQRVGTDVETGEQNLDLDWLETACLEGRGHNHLLLTTYRTACNYHHSLHRIEFSTLVFDEIQNLKNTATLTATACRTIRADFRIGLTGTPIENRVQDLWSIMDQVSPGSFDSLRNFTREYGEGDQESLGRLNKRLLQPFELRPAIGIRRLKQNVTTNLQAKQRVLLPSVMSERQSIAYDDTRVKLINSRKGGALAALHHIRSVSAHPGLVVGEQVESGDLVESSARLQQVIASLDWIAKIKERALVFVESRKLQYYLAEYLAARYDLPEVNIINGNTSISARQRIVNRFQQHLQDDNQFDVLVLGPRAAGTGLTLTAANHVLHVSRWWNPAVEEQCNDRVHRIGQRKSVTVHLPLAIHPKDCSGSFDCILQQLMLRKRTLATDVLAPISESEGDADLIQEAMASSGLIECPLFTSTVELRIWVEDKLGALAEIDSENPTVAIVLRENCNTGNEALHVQINRCIELHTGEKTFLDTRRSEGGTVITSLGGAMLSLWPNGVLEQGDRVHFVN